MKLHCEFDIHIGVPADDITDAIFLSILYCIVPLLYCLSILCSIFVFCFLCLLPKRKINLLSYIYIVRQKIAEMIVKVNQGIDESTIQ